MALTAKDYSGNSQTLKTTLTGGEHIVHHIIDNDVRTNVVSSVLPTDAATAANQTTINNTLTDIKTAVEILDNVIDGTLTRTAVMSSALPTNAATAANQVTINDTLTAIKTAVEILDNVISGTSTQTTLVSVIKPTVVNTYKESVTAGATQFNAGNSLFPTGVVTIKNPSSGSDAVYIGTSTVELSTGHLIEAGDSLTLEITDISTLYHRTSGTAAILTWIANT